MKKNYEKPQIEISVILEDVLLSNSGVMDYPFRDSLVFDDLFGDKE